MLRRGSPGWRVEAFGAWSLAGTSPVRPIQVYGHRMSDTNPSTGDNDLRQAAVHNLAKKRGFMTYLGSAVFVSLLMVVIWFLTGRGYFWPIWVMLGFLVGAIWMAINTFGNWNRGPSEDQIQSEMRRLSD